MIIELSFPIEAANTQGLFKGRPHLEAYLAKIHFRSAYKQALERGGEYE